MSDDASSNVKSDNLQNEVNNINDLETKNASNALPVATQRKPEKVNKSRRVASVSLNLFDKNGVLQVGRPTKLTPEIAASLLTFIGDGGSVAAWCRDNPVVERVTVWRWMDENEDFRHAYKLAREKHAHSIVEDLIPIISDNSRDLYDNGKVIAVNTAQVQRDWRHIGAIQWLAGKYNPIYADSAQGVQVNVQVNNAIDAPRQETREEWLARRQAEQDKDKDAK